MSDSAALTVVVPVGSIIAWIGSDPNTPNLPAGWIPCNGQSIVYPNSPYNGTIAPDLNLSGRFLRGGDQSGNYQVGSTIRESAGYGHDIYVSDYDEPVGSMGQGYYQNSNNASGDIAIYTLRPINMSVIWILRVI